MAHYVWATSVVSYLLIICYPNRENGVFCGALKPKLKPTGTQMSNGMFACYSTQTWSLVICAILHTLDDSQLFVRLLLSYTFGIHTLAQIKNQFSYDSIKDHGFFFKSFIGTKTAHVCWILKKCERVYLQRFFPLLFNEIIFMVLLFLCFVTLSTVSVSSNLFGYKLPKINGYVKVYHFFRCRKIISKKKAIFFN